MDKMIQDKLGDFREAPDPRVWDRVRDSLDQKKKKGRLIPLWLRLGVAAAVILAGFFWLAPREDLNTDTPAVSRTTTPQETPVSKGVHGAPADKAFPETTEASADRNDLPGGAKGSTGTPVERDAVVSAPGKADFPTGAESGQEEQAKEGLAATETQNRDQSLSDNNRDVTEEGRSQKAVIATPEQADAIADRSADRIAKDPGRTEKEVAGPEPKELPKKSILEALEPQEAVAETERQEGKWSVGPSLAPVYFNSFGSGSPIASNFLDNSKSGTVNMSYGLQVSYRLSKKLSLRSGIHRVDYGYNTDDVAFTSSPTARPSSLIRTISYSENSKSLVVHSTLDGAPPQQPAAADVSAPSPAREGQMLQEFGYLEIPVEMQYNLLDRKWGINLIGGLSSLFLVENSVSLQSGEAVTEIGEATNMNSLNFSTNFGLGFYYRLTSSFEVNLQPMFKYQLNTFTETSGSFQPYSIGVYSGLNFRF